MADTDDSRPFAALRQSAEEFKASFDEDITQCLAVLDSRITALLCDQDSVADHFSDAKRLNAHMEFSKAKLDIFLNMKNLMNDMETSWAEQLADLKESFIENVEIFLAGTKLEVNLPSESPRIKKGRKARFSSPFSSPNVSSLYPTTLLLNTAKHIPVLNTLLQKDTAEEHDKRDDKNQNAARRKNSVRFLDEVRMLEDVAMEADDEEQDVPNTPVQIRERRSRAAGATPASIKKTPVIQTPVMSGSKGVRKSILSTPSSEAKKNKLPSSLKREIMNLMESSGSSSGEEKSGSNMTPNKFPTRKTRGTPSQPLNASFTPGRQSRNTSKSSRGIANTPDVVPVVETTSPKRDIIKKTPSPVKKTAGSPSKTPKSVHFSIAMEEDDLGASNVRSLPRRKTAAVSQVANNVPDICLTPEIVRSKSKRKTVGGDLSDAAAPSPKRLKRGRSSTANSSIAMELGKADVSDFLESDEASEKDNYSSWIPLAEVGAKVPGQPGIYELKVSQAKKPAYIGACDSLRQKLTLHKLKHNSGHKHLDKFVERNAVNILLRYEKMPSVTAAKAEEKKRIQSFVARYNTTPAYN